MADPPDGRVLARAFAQAFTKAFEQAVGGRGGQPSLPHTIGSGGFWRRSARLLTEGVSWYVDGPLRCEVG